MANIGATIDKLYKLREQRRAHEANIKEINEQMKQIELDLRKQMEGQKLDKASGATASVTITSVTKPSVQDWDAFYAYIRRNKYFHLLERRPSVTGCRELFETKGKIPGVVPFVQQQVNLRANK